MDGTAIAALITFLVTQGVKSFLKLFGKDLSGGAAAFVAVLAGAVVFFFNGVIALIPPEQQQGVVAVLTFIAAILAAFGVHYTYKHVAGK
jgi:hypothetical protein